METLTRAGGCDSVADHGMRFLRYGWRLHFVFYSFLRQHKREVLYSSHPNNVHPMRTPEAHTTIGMSRTLVRKQAGVSNDV